MHAIEAAVTPLNWDLYRTAVVGIRFRDRTVRVEPRPSGTTQGSFPEPAGGSPVHVITAWNPLGRTASADANARAQRLLSDEIHRRGLTWWSAEGGDVHGTHREESVAVVGLSDTAARGLGRRFGQDAVFAWTPGAWRVLACGTGAASVSGWAAFESAAAGVFPVHRPNGAGPTASRPR
ncbi:DUF3293 domain-containing protein [Streptomyces sp. NPDC051133]|uniref:DUF3293 domain-containing protein n=1 Tax=Streptomyces sp. NPDC051133 TaxID=3155521 RepID=UPI00344295E2